MRIANPLPSLYAQNPAPPRNFNPVQQPQQQPDKGRPGVVVDISPEGWAAYYRGAERKAERIKTADNPTECKTCSSRKYADVSNDPSVSFQTPTHISPGQAAAVVASHESEHVSNEQAKAEQEGREIVSQTVTLRTSICPECKRVYISGGTTYTISVDKS